ncbi:hypothetical protein [Arsenophonus endosymbiont of Bemisia tabaci]|uniref:hypothetical protein n=1 Tax=Arsenophonus endosymbiont of Bemisia tabaci TaxID=536059 RepID=UPI00176D6814|nr:Cell division protein FtsN [Arsenophonus endosymbiont of Bemisia tabaci Q2]
MQAKKIKSRIAENNPFCRYCHRNCLYSWLITLRKINAFLCLTKQLHLTAISQSKVYLLNQEERWRYIKELEKRGSDLPNFNHSTKSNVNNTTELTNEQRQFLEQIDADRRNPTTNLSEVPNNDNVPRSHVIINGPPIESPLRLKPAPQAPTTNK